MPYKDPIRARESQRERSRRYNEKHRNQRREAARQYYYANREARIEYSRKWRATNPEKANEAKRRYYRENEKERARQRAYNKRWRLNNPGRKRAWAGGNEYYKRRNIELTAAKAFFRSLGLIPVSNRASAHRVGRAALVCVRKAGLLLPKP